MAQMIMMKQAPFSLPKLVIVHIVITNIFKIAFNKLFLILKIAVNFVYIIIITNQHLKRFFFYFNFKLPWITKVSYFGKVFEKCFPSFSLLYNEMFRSREESEVAVFYSYFHSSFSPISSPCGGSKPMGPIF